MNAIRYLSFGAGVQSTALLVMAATGRCARPDLAIFADTQAEPSWVYENLDRMTGWAAERGIEVARVTAGNLEKDAIAGRNVTRTGKSRFVSIPAFTASLGGRREGRLQRQCTREYKLDAITREVRRRLGLRPRQRASPRRATALIGISLDEAQRMKPSHVPWIENTYPLIDANMSRQDCITVLGGLGIPIPLKSACYFCPFHDNAYWLAMKRNHPEEFARAVAFDAKIRHQSAAGFKRPIFLHRSCQPLGQVEFRSKQRAFAWDSFTEECEGMCGI